MDTYEPIVYFRSDKCTVKDSNIHGKGVFSGQNIPVGTIMCSIPGIYVYNPTPIDTKREFYFDSTCFSSTMVLPDGIGHFINSSHPNAFRREHRDPNCRYVDMGNGSIVVQSIRNIDSGEELLCDYHWHVEILDDENRISDFIHKVGQQQHSCNECVKSRRQRNMHFDNVEKHDGHNVLDSNFEVQVRYLKLIFRDSCGVGGLGIADGSLLCDEISQFSAKELLEVIDECVPASKPHRTFVQLGSKLGFESLAAACYLNNLSSSYFVTTMDTGIARKILSSIISIVQPLLKRRRSTFTMLIEDDVAVAYTNIVSSLGPTFLIISSDIKDTLAMSIAIGACRTPSIEVLVTFSSFVVDAVKPMGFSVSRTIICFTISSIDEKLCYVLVKKGRPSNSRAMEQCIRNQCIRISAEKNEFNTFTVDQSRIINGHIIQQLGPISGGKDMKIKEISNVRKRTKIKGTSKMPLAPLSKKQCQKLELSTGGGFMRANLVQKFFNFENTGMIWREECALPPESFRKRMGFVNIDTIFGIPANSNPSFHVSKALWEAEKMYSDINIEILCGITRLAIEECSATKGKVGLLPPSFFSTVEHIPSMNLSASSWERMHPNLSIQCLETLICIMHGNSHYAVLQVDFQTFQVTVHDSLYGVVDWDSYVQAVLKFVFVTRKIETKIWEIVQNSTMPQQGNGTDCGVYAAATSMLLALNAPRASWAYQLRNPNALRCLFATMFLDCVNYLNNEQALPHRLGLSNGSPPITFLNSMASSASASGSVTGSSRIMNKRHAADKSLTTLDYGLLVKISGLTQSDLYLERYCD